MPVRVSEIPNLNPTRLNAAPMDARAAGAPAGALGELAQGIASAGVEFEKVSHQVQDAENAKVESQIQNHWRSSWADFQQKLDQEPSAEERRRRSNEFIESLQHGIDAPGVAPIVRERLRLKFSDWATGASIGATADAARFELKQADDAFAAGWPEAVRLGDRKWAGELIESREAHRLLTPGEKQQLWQQFDRQESVDRLSRMVTDDPLGAREMFKSRDILRETPGLTEADRQKFLGAAESEVSTLQKESIRAIADKIDRLEITTDAELEGAWKDNPFVENGYKDELRWSLTQRTPVDQETRFGLVDSLNDLHDSYKAGEMTLEEYRFAHDELGRAIYSLGARDGAGALRQRLHSLDSANWSNGRELQEKNRKESLQRSVEAISKLYAAQNAFGEVDEDAEPAARAEQSVDAYRRRGRIEETMLRWMEQHPEATEDEVSTRYRKAYLDELAAPILSLGKWTPVEKRRAMLEEVTGGNVGGPKGARNDTPDRPAGSDLKSMVKAFEAGGADGGFHREAYWDYGQWSIGYGTKSKEGEIVDQGEAERRLDAELDEARQHVIRIADKYRLQFAPHEIDALTSFTYNAGPGGSDMKKGLEGLLKGGTRSKAEIASTMLLYRQAGGKRLRGLERRRVAEAHLFRRGWDVSALPTHGPAPDEWNPEDPTAPETLPE